jgi:hypothetical protein
MRQNDVDPLSAMLNTMEPHDVHMRETYKAKKKRPTLERGGKFLYVTAKIMKNYKCANAEKVGGV